MDIERAKNDPVYFVECMYNIPLTKWQKLVLRAMHKNRSIIYQGRAYGRLFMYDVWKKYESLSTK